MEAKTLAAPLCQVPEEQGEDDSSEKTPSKASKSPQKTTKRPKTVPIKVALLDGSNYEAAVEVRPRSSAMGTGHNTQQDLGRLHGEQWQVKQMFESRNISPLTSRSSWS